MKKFSIGVLGAGTWGMALARMLTVSGNDVQVWSAIEAEVDNLSTTRVHPNLPGMVIPQELRFTKSIEEVCTGKDVLLFAVPSVFVRATAAKARPYIRSGQIIVDVAKGIEPDTLYTMTEILADELSHENGPRAVRLVALSGPTHAEEVALDLPTTIVSASPDLEAAEVVQEVFSNTCMRVYTNTDIKGVELSGAMKNVIALGVGISTVKKIITATMTATPISRESTSIARLVRRNCPFRVVFFGMAPASFWISPRHFTIRLPSCQRGDSRSIQRPGRTPPEGQCGAATRRRAGQSQSKDCATGDTR